MGQLPEVKIRLWVSSEALFIQSKRENTPEVIARLWVNQGSLPLTLNQLFVACRPLFYVIFLIYFFMLVSRRLLNFHTKFI